jgi:peptide/nickel transport system permease protein
MAAASTSTDTRTKDLAKPPSRLRLWYDSRLGKSFRGNPKVIISIITLLFLAFVAIFAPFLAPPAGDCLLDLGGTRGGSATVAQRIKAIFAPPSSCLSMPKLSLSSEPTPPSLKAPLGTVNGYDILYGLVWGTRAAFGIGLLVVAISLVIGVFVGLASGFFGGWIDNLLMRFVDLINAFPGLILTLVLIALLGRSLTNVAISFILVGWTGYARLVRGDVLRARTLEYVEASRALGASRFRMMVKHIFPNVVKPLLVSIAVDMGGVPLLFSGLSFLGISTPPGFADWGQLIDLAQQWVQGRPGQPFVYWYVSLFPGIAILLYTLSWNFIGDALQDGVDVKST